MFEEFSVGLDTSPKDRNNLDPDSVNPDPKH
jgi:hypothetical protein